ncbi:YjcZ family sporulation protein [Ectobacillus funiculus]|uniref:YjcZ family sporulation protein n=1 Tax=Ectobacillus funiculus TaxID=137993 RepID=UPI00397E74C4
MSDGGVACGTDRETDCGHGHSKGLTLMLVLFILLIIIGVGVAWFGSQDDNSF